MKKILPRIPILLLLLCSSVCLVHAQKSVTEVSLELSEVSLQETLERVGRQTNHRVVCIPSDLLRNHTRRVSIHLQRVELPEALNRILAGTGLAYKIEGKAITITTAEKWITVRGRVLDKNGSPLPGAMIRIKGANKGVVADMDGKYEVKVPGLHSVTLIYSLVGMKTKTLTPKKAEVDVVLQEDIQSLKGIVVESTGYQDTDKRISTSSVVTLDAGEVLTANTATLDNMLMGKVPGLTVLTDVSTPGVAAKIRVRGVSTLSGSREPLWVVDGIILDDPVPLSAEEINSLDNVNLIGNAISGLNPMDIEKIDVLKDAAATAIYGVRAANGVIVITTKKGEEGRFSVNYRGSANFSQRPNYGQMALMNSKERIDVSKEIEEKHLQYGLNISRVAYEGLLMDLYDRKITETQFLEEVKKLEENNTDWFGHFFHHTISQQHNLSVSGGNSKMTYYSSASLSTTPDVIKSKGVKSYNGMLKMQFRPTSKISANVQLRANGNKKNYTYNSVSPYKYALNTSRAIPAFDEKGNRFFYNEKQGFGSGNTLLFNMMNEMDHSGNTISNSGYNANLFFEYRPMLDLKLNTTFGLNVMNTLDESWFDAESFEASKLRKTNFGDPLPDAKIFKEEQALLPYGGMLRTGATKNIAWQWRAQLLYNWRPAHNHTLSINVGPEIRSTRYNGFQSTQFGYLPERGKSFMYIDPAVWIAHKKFVKNYPDRITDRLSNFVSVFANLVYSYDRRYIFTYNVRAEGSNKFGQDPKARFLPIWSLSGRWNLHEEKFMEGLSWLNLLALKASYGLQGNVSEDQTPTLIARYGEYQEVSGLFQSHTSKLPNPNLRWEKNTSWNLALETALWDNRLTFNVDYYRRIGTDQLVNKVVSHTLGQTNIQINAGTLLNEGLDFMLTATPIRTKDWTWTFNLNGAYNRNVVTDGGINSEFTYQQYLDGNVIKNGYPVNAFYSYRFDRLDERGLPSFHGIEEGKDGETKEEFFARVFTPSGSRIPYSQGGIGTSVRWKDLTLNVFFSYSLGNRIRLNDLYKDSGQGTPYPQQNLSSELVNRWRKPGDENTTNIPAISNERLDDVEYKKSNFLGESSKYKYSFARNLWQMYNKSDLRVASGTHLRMRSASLNYRLPSSLLEKTILKTANVRLEGYNLFLLADPKLNGQDPSQMVLGSRTTPPLPSFALTLDLSF